MTKVRWEYRVDEMNLAGNDGETSRADAAAALDRLGREGWEAVGFSPSNAASHGLRVETTRYLVLLKRRSSG